MPGEHSREQERDEKKDVIIASPDMKDAFAQEDEQLLTACGRGAERNVEGGMAQIENGLLGKSPILQARDAAHLRIESENDFGVQFELRGALRPTLRLQGQHEPIAIAARG